MAHYVKFEIYFPTQYTDAQGNRRDIDTRDIRELGTTLIQNFGGYTETNPVQAPPFKGWWKSHHISVDFLTSMFVLVPQDRQEEALDFFTKWKKELEQKYSQGFVLIVFSPLQVIGQL